MKGRVPPLRLLIQVTAGRGNTHTHRHRHTHTDSQDTGYMPQGVFHSLAASGRSVIITQRERKQDLIFFLYNLPFVKKKNVSPNILGTKI